MSCQTYLDYFLTLEFTFNMVTYIFQDLSIYACCISFSLGLFNSRVNPHIAEAGMPSYM